MWNGGKARLGGILKRGRYVRTLLIHGARAVVQRAEQRLKHRKGTMV